MKLKIFNAAAILSIAATNHVQAANRHTPDVATIKAINQAATNGNVAKLEEFFAAGYDINAPDSMGSSPLHNAAFYGHEAAVRFLLGHEASVEATNSELDTPLHMATMESYAEDILEVTNPTIAARSELRNHLAVVSALLIAGAKPNARNKIGNTPMHNAMMYCSEEIFKAMLEGSGDLTIRNKAGALPIDLKPCKSFC